MRIGSRISGSLDQSSGPSGTKLALGVFTSSTEVDQSARSSPKWSTSEREMSAGKLLLVDTDAGVDDAAALLMALAAHKKGENKKGFLRDPDGTFKLASVTKVTKTSEKTCGIHVVF